MTTHTKTDSARLNIDHPTQKRDRLTVFFRFILALPILALLSLVAVSGGGPMGEPGMMFEAGSQVAMGMFVAAALMIVFRQRYPRWWFDFLLELNRFSTRVSAYLLLLTDRYPSTVEQQTVHLDIMYPDAKQELNQWLPLIKWFLAIPHYVVLFFLVVGMMFTTIVAWFSILFTGRYPKTLFDYAVGVMRWDLRVNAYAFLLITDQYPPFSLK